MQRILQINIAGRVLPIEEDAYMMLKDYISALERQFSGPDSRDIIEDIEHRISELFSIRLQGGVAAIDRNDVQKVISTLGAPGDIFDNQSSGAPPPPPKSAAYSGYQGNNRKSYSNYQYRLLRDPFNKVLGGVCSGLAHYFDVDPVIIRLIMVVLFLTFGIGFVAYVIAWLVIPQARTMEELYYGTPMSIHDISRNMAEELDDLKRRGEQMSRELKDFFSNKR
jgi:phage shock protein C